MFRSRQISNAFQILRQLRASTARNYFKPTNAFLSSQSKIIFPSTGVSNFRRFSTAKESSLVDFLKEEIEAEKKLGKQHLVGGQQPSVPGYQIKTDQREVVLTKQHGNEKITITFDINHTVDSDEEMPESDSQKPAEQQSQEPPRMVSSPSFTVEVQKGDQKLVFECSFIEPDYDDDNAAEEYSDLFNIEEIYTYSGEFNEKNKIYAVSGSIIDGTLYDHMMNFLEERGIDNDFAQNLSRFATWYEHGQYINLLQKMRDFISH